MLAEEDAQLISNASAFLEKYYARGRHHVACALRCGQNTYFALHLDSTGFDVCAEPIALSNALQAEETEFELLAAVGWNGAPATHPELIAPCGDCRQILVDYAPELRVIVPGVGSPGTVMARELLPFSYRKVEQM